MKLYFFSQFFLPQLTYKYSNIFYKNRFVYNAATKSVRFK